MDTKKISIAGFGRTGKALLTFLLNDKNISEIIIFDDNRVDLNGTSVSSDHVKIEAVSGSEGILKMSGSDIVILSPGVNGRDERFLPLRESGAKIISEMEFASSFIGSGIVAVTGTNGKSTTVSLIHHILKGSGLDSFLTGNIGIPLISQVQEIGKDSVTVLEVSSFQLEEIEEFRPEVTLILNVTPDHLDRYPSLSDYVEAKLNILKNLNSKDPVVLNYDDPFLRERFFESEEGNFRKIWFSLERGGFDEGAWINEGNAVVRLDGSEVMVPLEGNPLIGSHNLENILASLIAALLKGVSPEGIPELIKSFRGLSHRMEVCGEKAGVRFINDSKATNVEATVKSIKGIDDDIALILGGKDKGGDFSLIKNYIGTKIKRIILIGEAADTISAALNSDKKFITRADALDEALGKGFEVLAGSGGTVLLAPGCASFDMFRNYEERGNIFKNEVHKFIQGI
ncbi:MAG: UDP-N-acetylmuramoyl-L-alanine--D-glutamate ligase [Acidobacteriota bacterium]